MKKQRFVSLLTAAAVSCTFLFSTAYADGEYINNFNKINAYTANQFSDIGSEWYAPSVQTVYEIGLMNGDSASTFNPSGNLSNAEAVAIAARLHSIYNTGADNFTQSSPWYQSYMDYAVSNGICSANFNPEDTANRSFFVGILGNAVDSSVLTQKNTIADGDLYDVDGWYSPAVYSFYRAGVLGGNDAYGTFAPDTPITRAEAAAVLVRLVKPSDRIDVVLQERPAGGTYSIMADDGSLEAYRQRALAANFEVLLGGKAKTPEWESDVYTIEHREIKGTPSETIVIPREYIDSRYDAQIDEHCIVFKASHIDPSLSGEISIPVYFVERNLSISPAGKGGRLYRLSVINTGGKVDFLGGTAIQGDLQLYYDGEEDIPAWTETVTYDNYTAEAQSMIDAAEIYYKIGASDVTEFVGQRIDENDVIEYIENEYVKGGSSFFQPVIGYLVSENGGWSVKINTNDMYDLSAVPASANGSVTLEPLTEEASAWLNAHCNEYIIALVMENESNAPVMLAQISGGDRSSGSDWTVKSWYFDGNGLKIYYGSNSISADTVSGYQFTDQLKVVDFSQ